jgi:hypothetical protein
MKAGHFFCIDPHERQNSTPLISVRQKRVPGKALFQQVRPVFGLNQVSMRFVTIVSATAAEELLQADWGRISVLETLCHH